MLRKVLRRFGYSLQKLRRSDDELDVLTMALKLTQPTLIFDCGANQGNFAKLCRAAFYQGPIWCFDPNRECVGVLEALAREDRRIRVFAQGTGECSGVVELQVAGDDGNMGSLLPQEAWLTDRFRSAWVRDRYEVPVKRLDDVCDSEGVSGEEKIFLKMDTQGFDCATFRGMGDRLRQVVAVKAEFAVQTIYQGAPLHWEMLDLLREYGFEPFWFSTVSRGFDGRLIEYDAYFVKIS